MKGQRYIWIERRLYPSLRMEVLAAILSILLALLAIGVLFGVVGVDPLFVYRRIFMGAFGSLFGLSETIVKAIPLMLVGVGLTLAFRARMWNIGAEGQLLMGAIAATGVALTFPDLPAGVLLPAMFVAGFVGGALWGLIPALLKVYFRANEVLTSLMLVYVASEAVNYLVYGPWRGPEEMGFPLTSKFSPAAQLPRLLNTRIHYLTLLLALLLAVLVYLLVRRTRLGYEIRVTGENPTAARYAGMDYTKIVLLVMLLSGGLAGLAGVGEVAGIHHRMHYPAGISPGYGFTAIIVAWLARLNPLAAILTAFLLGGLLVGGHSIQIALGLPVATIHIFNGVILLFVLGGELFTRYQIRLKRRPEP